MLVMHEKFCIICQVNIYCYESKLVFFILNDMQ